jgi:molecular chaperone DnaJ
MMCDDLRCYYGVLDLPLGADQQAVTKKYRKLAMKYHPDRNRGMEAESTTQFKRLKEAYEILTGKRRRPPNCGCPDKSEAKSQPQGEPAGTYYGTTGFGTGGYSSQQVREDVFANINIPLEMAFAGGRVPIQVYIQQACGWCNGKENSSLFSTPCPVCNGTGKQAKVGRWGSSTCQACNGSGRAKSTCRFCHGSGMTYGTRDVEVCVPPRTAPGVLLRVKGAGHLGTGAIATGDVVVSVSIDWPHPHYRLIDKSIEGPVWVDCLAAILGGTTEAVVLGSSVTVEIPEDVHAGIEITVPKQGLKDDWGRVGDLRLHVVLDVFKPVDNDIREKLRAVFATGSQP